MKFAIRSRQARRYAGLSQEQLASAIGVGRSAVANWEGRSGPLPSMAHMLAHACATEVALEWLATGRGPMQLVHDPRDDLPAVDGVLVIDCPHERELLLDFRVASPNAQFLAIEVVKESAYLRANRRSR